MVRLAMETVSARKRIYITEVVRLVGSTSSGMMLRNFIRLLSPNRDQEKDVFECIVGRQGLNLCGPERHIDKTECFTIDILQSFNQLVPAMRNFCSTLGRYAP